MYFENELALEEAKKSYDDHPLLMLAARDRRSFEFMLQHFEKPSVVLIPDMVNFLAGKLQETNATRSNILVCFRKDSENVIDLKLKRVIVEELRARYSNVVDRDTIIANKIMSEGERQSYLKEIF